MLYPQVDPKIWSARYNIRTKGVDCPSCGHILNFEKPIATKGYRGLEVGPCGGCGEDTGVFRVVPVEKEKIELWESLKPSEPQAL